MAQSFMERMRAQIANVGASLSSAVSNLVPAREARQERNLVKTGGWDRRNYQEKARHLRVTEELIHDLDIGDKWQGGKREGFDPAPEFVEAMFHTLHKAAPRLNEVRRLERELVPGLKVLQKMMEHPRYAELQEYTVGDTSMSVMAMTAMGDVVRDMLEVASEVKPPPAPRLPNIGQPDPNGEPEEGDGEPGDQPGSDGRSEEGDGEGEGRPDPDGEFDPDAEEEFNQAESDWEAAYDAAFDAVDLERLADKAVGEAADNAQELEDTRKGIGLDDGEWEQMDPSRRLALAEHMLTPEMRVLSWIIGRMRRFALGIKATRITDVPHEAFDVEFGDDLRRVLPGQYALLGHRQAALEFYRRYSQKELQIYKKRGTEEVGKGPIVICIDRSGSMSGAPMQWAMAVAEALRRYAMEDRRDFYAVFFGTNVQREVHDFPEGRGTIEEVLAFLSAKPDWGTEFDGILNYALDYASTAYDEEAKGKADVVFVTDGNANLSDQWIEGFNAERRRTGVRCYSVYIGGASDMAGKTGPLGLLGKISDVCIPIRELKPESVREVFLRV